jgi:hypothetical protein
MLDYNWLFHWFLDVKLEEPSFEHSMFSKSRERLSESRTAEPILERLRIGRRQMRSRGADECCHSKVFVEKLRARNNAPHIPRIEERHTRGLYSRITRHEAYVVEQSERKRLSAR